MAGNVVFTEQKSVIRAERRYFPVDTGGRQALFAQVHNPAAYIGPEGFGGFFSGCIPQVCLKLKQILAVGLQCVGAAAFLVPEIRKKKGGHFLLRR